jgi:hypothetical protein
MKRCPSCNRTYTDDTMTNCAHDGAPLMPTAYSPQGAPMIPPPQGFAPPPPGYPPQPQAHPAYTPQNYPPQYPLPPGGYAPPNYAPQPGGNLYVSCPRCMSPYPEQVKFTWWGGMMGPRMLDHVRCRTCALEYNGKTGQSNSSKITTYIIVSSVIVFAITLTVILLVFKK